MEKTHDEEWDYYTLNGKKVCVATDRESSYGRTVGEIPFKGYVLCALANQCNTDIINTDIIESPAPRIIIAKNLKKLPVIIFVMGYLTAEYGILSQYQKGVRNICGHALPAGLKENQKLDSSLIIPVMNNHILSKEAIFAEGLVDEAIFEEIEIKAKRLFAQGTADAEKNNCVLATAQYEFAQENSSAVVLHGYHSYKTAVYRENGRKIEPTVVKAWLDSVGFKGNGPAPPIPTDIRKKASEEYLAIYKKLRGKDLAVPKKDVDVSRFIQLM